GQTLADLLLDKQTDRTALPWVNRRPRKWEPEPLRWLGVQGMYWLYTLADRREAASGGAQTSRLASLADRLTGR
ncbi:FAD-dependent oxidoreductase, partial [Rhodobacter capsulatus]